MRIRADAVLRGVLTLVVAAGLVVDAVVHLDLAPDYDSVSSSLLSEGDLFRVEGALALLALAALVLRPRRYTAALAFVVTAGGLAAVLVYQYVDVGSLGPIPDMYEPVWYREKTQSAWSEGIAALAALSLLLLRHVRDRPVRAEGQLDPASR